MMTVETKSLEVESKASENLAQPTPFSFQAINSAEFLSALRSSGKTGQRAFRKLVNETHGSLTRFLSKYIHSRESVQEALQETYLGIHRSLDSFEGNCQLNTWIFSLAYRKACDTLAQKYRGQNLRREMDFELEFIEDLESRFMAPDDEFYQTRLVQEVKDAAQLLPILYRDAYQLRDIDGLTGEEASEILGISPTLLRVRLHRARGLIVERLQMKLPSLFENSVKS